MIKIILNLKVISALKLLYIYLYGKKKLRFKIYF